ncbi:glycosyltransferase [Stutzerimonas stutzeri]|uniref:glycosyltransferase n=1 Tax=Stutzerimonas stutzeri TaxID=316 RepID=UPI00210EBBEC|nr:glycosyltransferase [Stutzerimonas stutzeri]MCQ4322842.1 glycosyltransferase [Stutzerimonas stutzeri]
MNDDFYRALEERFRASREEIRARLSGYRPFLDAMLEIHERPSAFDIGCGRGEWLQLLGEAGFDASGVDLDDAMLAACHEAHLQARNDDALTALRAVPDNSYHLITSFHVVEHLEFDYLRKLLKEAFRTLTPDGLLILETPNSENLIVGTSSFYLDPTHQRPVPALFLDFLCEQSGFARSKVVRLQEDPALRSPDAGIGLWQVLYGVSPDYAIVAQKNVPTANQADTFAELFARDYGLGLEALAVRHDQQVTHLFQRQAQDQQALNTWNAERFSHFEERLVDLDFRCKQAELRCKQAELRCEQAELRCEQAELRCEQAEARCDETESALQQVYHSRSWRITQPVRDVADFLRHLDRPRAQQMLLRPVRAGVSSLRSRPTLTAPLLRAARRVPALESWLRKLQTTLERPYASAGGYAANYSPRAIRLASRMSRLGARDERPSTAGLPRLAFVSPLPPERTGIADYSAELLPELANYYQIDVIVAQSAVESSWVTEHCQVRDAQWLREHMHDVDAVLYHFGNSDYHGWMVSLLEDVPGIVVLHDFFLSGLIWSLEAQPQHQGIKLRELYYSHGYPALVEALNGEEGAQIAFRYPFNRTIIEAAQGVIVHSDVSFRLARQWYGDKVARDWRRIPLVRVPAALESKRVARERLQIPDTAFVICSYGQLGVTKLNHRLLEAWLESDLAQDPDCLLVFVGELGNDEYGQSLRTAMLDSGVEARIKVTGWVSSESFRDYLAATDLAVQLRTLSRGETSAAVLDCMNHALPTIVNANGSMADLPAEGVHRIPDEFETAELTSAINHFWVEHDARQALGQRAKAFIEAEHSPAGCALLYRDAISTFMAQARQNEQQLRQAMSVLPGQATDEALLPLAERLVSSVGAPARQRQLLLDVTATSRLDRHTGIERVAKALVISLLGTPPPGCRVEPVYLTDEGGHWHYRYASAFTARLLGIPEVIQDQGVDFTEGDRLIALDYSGDAFIRASQQGLFTCIREQGVNCRVLVHDLLPVTRPELFPPRSDDHFARWLSCVALLDGAVFVTRTVADEMRRWLADTHPDVVDTFTFDYSHHGADLSSAAPSHGMPADADEILAKLAARSSVLMVGTLEPRKGYLQALAAFTQLWEAGSEINLVIVGREGWQDVSDEQRRDIPELIRRIRQHPQLGERLFWLDGISDEFLEKVYASVDGLLAASLDEGFGLPLIEAAQKGVPILARDIPVFREVAGDHACFFSADSASELEMAISAWQSGGFKPASGDMPWLTWQQSADNLQRIMLR